MDTKTIGALAVGLLVGGTAGYFLGGEGGEADPCDGVVLNISSDSAMVIGADSAMVVGADCATLQFTSGTLNAGDTVVVEVRR